MATGSSNPALKSGRRDTNILGNTVTLGEVDAIYRAERRAFRKKIGLVCIAILVVCFFSFCITGAQYNYRFFTPLQVLEGLAAHLHDFFGPLTRLAASYSPSYIEQNIPIYYIIPQRLSIIGLTLLCGVLLSVSGMLFQNVFKNPIAGPGMLGVGSGVSVGVLILVLTQGIAGIGNVGLRYGLCYGLGMLVLILVLGVGKLLSGRKRPINLINMLLMGSLLSQLIGVVMSYITLYVMDPETWLVYYTASQILNMDGSSLSWLTLGAASLLSLVPVFLLRFKLNTLAFSEEEAKVLGVNAGLLRAVALVCGSIMILAAQVQIGMVAMISLIVPFVARSVFGCEFKRQFAGNIVCGMLVLLICRNATDAIPFVGDGLAIGSLVSVVALPLFMWIMAKYRRGWE